MLTRTPIYINNNGKIEFKERAIKPFEVKTIKLTVTVKTTETMSISPIVTYIDNSGTTKTSSYRQFTISPQPAPEKKQMILKPLQAKSTPLKPFQVFLCYKKSSGKDFADHLKAGLEELGYHTFQDSKDIPMITSNEERWDQIRDQALLESPVFILVMTPGFELSAEVIKELNMARKAGNKRFIFFRIRSMARKFSIKLDNEVFDTGKQEQVSFETKEELLRLAHNILFK